MDADEEAVARAPSDPDTDPPAAADGQSVGTRVDSVLAAAELAAAGIREEARDWARQHKEESQKQADQLAARRLRELSSLTEDLRSRARAIAEECDQLIKAIDQAPSAPTPDDSGAKPGLAGMNSQEANGGPDTENHADLDPVDESQISDRARLFAAQLIAAGGSRDEISQRLREEFGVQDASAMLDRMGA